MALLSIVTAGLLSAAIVLSCPWCCDCDCVCCEVVGRRVMGVPDHMKIGNDGKGAYYNIV